MNIRDEWKRLFVNIVGFSPPLVVKRRWKPPGDFARWDGNVLER
jgi:hypothetical protein